MEMANLTLFSLPVVQVSSREDVTKGEYSREDYREADDEEANGLKLPEMSQLVQDFIQVHRLMSLLRAA
jgi:hypothetical protein